MHAAEFVKMFSDIENSPHDAKADPKCYALGFLFDEDDNVALIEKTRPAWQAGKLNGIGGKVEDGETPRNAMVREFEEEAGGIVTDWRLFAVLEHDGAFIFMYASKGYVSIESATDEKVMWYPSQALHRFPVMPNLRWLVPMAASGNNEVAFVCDPTKVPK